MHKLALMYTTSCIFNLMLVKRQHKQLLLLCLPCMWQRR
jgi:hypothetical protein